MNLKPGMRVKSLVNDGHVKVGWIGTVLKEPKDMLVQIDFDNLLTGHECLSHVPLSIPCREKHGRSMLLKEVRPVRTKVAASRRGGLPNGKLPGAPTARAGCRVSARAKTHGGQHVAAGKLTPKFMCSSSVERMRCDGLCYECLYRKPA